MTDMRHLEFLQAVVDDDVRVLREKESTYRGSWKKRGGVGAWMMLVRNWDRLENFLDPTHVPGDQREAPFAVKANRPIPAYDVFEAIAAAPDGDDGTPLACVRDARRYLTLVEAEMRARGAVAYETEPVVASALPVLRLDDPVPPGTPEDGGQHESRAPWALVVRHGGAEFDRWWTAYGRGLWLLRPWVEGLLGPPKHLIGLYKPVSAVQHVVAVGRDTRTFSVPPGYLLNLRTCPPGARSWFPRLDRELNAHEWTAVEDWAKSLYEWHEAESKYRLRPEHAAWCVA